MRSSIKSMWGISKYFLANGTYSKIKTQKKDNHRKMFVILPVQAYQKITLFGNRNDQQYLTIL